MIWQIPFCKHRSCELDPLFVTVVIFIPKQLHSTVRFRTASSVIGCLITWISGHFENKSTMARYATPSISPFSLVVQCVQYFSRSWLFPILNCWRTWFWRHDGISTASPYIKHPLIIERYSWQLKTELTLFGWFLAKIPAIRIPAWGIYYIAPVLAVTSSTQIASDCIHWTTF